LIFGIKLRRDGEEQLEASHKISEDEYLMDSFGFLK
jgi:hypothetical protein